MNHLGVSCLHNNYSNIASRQKAYTFQHTTDKRFILDKYFTSQAKFVAPNIAANYANVPPNVSNESRSLMKAANYHNPSNHHHRQISHHSHHSRSQHLHSRSQSQHYYQTMPHPHPYPPADNDQTNYYNLTPNAPAPPQITGLRHSPINEPPLHIHRAQLDSLTVMQVCNELGNNIDSSPPMPSSRQYSIVITHRGRFKVAFPQLRTMTKNYQDSRVFIREGEIVSVAGPSKQDRSKFTIYYKEQELDIPHQFTQHLLGQPRYHH